MKKLKLSVILVAILLTLLTLGAHRVFFYEAPAEEAFGPPVRE